MHETTTETQPSAAPPSPARRAFFPLWAKLGLVFGLLVGLLIASYGLFSYRAELLRERVEHQDRLLGLAQTIAGAIDGDLHRSFTRTRDAKRPEFQRLYDWLRMVADKNGLKWAGTLQRDAEGHFAYGVDGSEASPLPPTYPLFDVSPAHQQAWAGEAVFVAGMVDEWGRWDAAFAPVRDSSGAVVALLELDYDANLLDLVRRARTRRLLIQILLGVLLSIGTAVLFARYLNRHLGKLTVSVMEVASGDLEHQVTIPTRDEIGMLGGAFNKMVVGLKEREFIRESFGRYVTEEVVSKVLSDPDALRLGGDVRKVSVIMTDLRGFTSLSERLGPEQMVALLNRYFGRMADVVMSFGGVINEFTGDGMVILFGAPVAQPDDSLRAAACAVAMQIELARFNADEQRALDMGIGIDTGRVIAGNIGSERRMKYGVVGDPINYAARLESITAGSQIMISEALREELGAALVVGREEHFQPKGKASPQVAFELLGVGAPYDSAVPQHAAEPEQSVDLVAACARVEGKQVEEEVHAAQVLGLQRSGARLASRWTPERFGNLRLRIELPDGRAADDIYAKVMEVEAPTAPEAPAISRLRFTSVPDAARAALDSLLPGAAPAPPV